MTSPTTLSPAIPTGRAIRDELLQLVLMDLYGPAAGPTEEVIERSVQDRYLTGMLAPKNRSSSSKGGKSGSVKSGLAKNGSPKPGGAAKTVALEDVAGEGAEGDDAEEFPPVELDELATGGTDSAEDGKAEPSIAPDRTLFPSSFGMTFCVDGEATSIRATARWGWYRRAPSASLLDKEGKPKRVWLRTPREGTTEIPLVEGKIAPRAPCEEQDRVLVQGVVRRRDSIWIVTLFLVNEQHEPAKGKDEAWLFQAELAVEGPSGDAIFVRRPVLLDYGRIDCGEEDRAMDMLYRRRLEMATGHGVGVHWDSPKGDPTRAVRVETRFLPRHEVAKVAPPGASEIPGMDGLELDMKALSETAREELAAKLRPLTDAYAGWIEEQRRRAGDPTEGLADFGPAVEDAIENCERTLGRIREGITLVTEDETAFEAFRFMNRAMWLQRVRTIYARERRREANPDLAALEATPQRWYPFQLGFILLNLEGISRLDHPDRTGRQEAVADLLWFPTGGGKTEAYLGLTAFTLANRRLRKNEGGRDGENGVAVLMRYTLRLLTLQQFQRATTLICACETIRREAVAAGDARWGRVPFRVGLWVGRRATPNTTAQSEDSLLKDHGQQGSTLGGSGSPHQLNHCPWCGTKIDPSKNIRVEKAPAGDGRTLVHCGDSLGMCEFTERRSPGEGLPILVVDEEIYRRLPSLLIATVDKFAQLPWRGEAQMLFGQVNGECERHGFRSPDIEDADMHPATKGRPKAVTRSRGPLRPPDLIIQDELHLISGPLGSLAGLYETVIDHLCSWEVNGKTVRPKVVASTATIRRAKDQVYALFMRQVNVFPPGGLDVEDNFFARERDCDDATPGRLYLGICAPGRRLKAALIRTYLALLAAGQTLYDRKGYGDAADPWMTLLGYFNSLRELGGMRRLVLDDVRSRLKDMEERGLAKRSISESTVDELTSRKGTLDIPRLLDRLEVRFGGPKERGRDPKERGAALPLDVMLATNMVSVGVDVERLGVMVVAGQPKTTGEYIQATSRVGRRFPGLVCTVFNWARPRDLSHYEHFEHYHATFYKRVEALSVTPFSCGAIDRGLAALLVACVRQGGNELNANEDAGRIDRNHPLVQKALEVIGERAGIVSGSTSVRDNLVVPGLNSLLDDWKSRAGKKGVELGYKTTKNGVTTGILEKAGKGRWKRWTCLDSLRDVEPSVNLILDDRGMDRGKESPHGV